MLISMPDSFVDLVVTSPPYDKLRTYEGAIDSWSFDKFKKIADELYRVVKQGGVIVWVVGDATVNGSESGTSFRQALYFKDIGFKLYDTMIYQKQNCMPLTHRRYEQEFEYMFVLSKGKPKTFNPIKIPCKFAGAETFGETSFHTSNNSGLVKKGKRVINEYKQHGNIFTYRVGSLRSEKGVQHPAPFPAQLAKDMVSSWSNEGDLVLEPFSGSGTVMKVCKDLGRNFIGAEIIREYYNASKQGV